MTSSVRLGQDASSAASSGAASITCSRLSRSSSISRSPMCSARPSLAPSVWAIVSVDERRVAERGQPDPEDARLVLGTSVGGGLIASRVFPVPPGPVSVTSRAPSTKQGEDLQRARVSSDEGARGPGQVRVGDRLQRREGSLPNWKIGTGRDVLEAVLAEVGELAVDEHGGRTGEEHLTAVAGGGDARAEWTSSPTYPSSVSSGVPVCKPMRTWIGPPRAPRSSLPRPRARPARRKGEEERVSLRVHLHSAVAAQASRITPPVLGKRLGVRLGAELVQQLRRALDVGEEERDGAGRQIHAHFSGMMIAECARMSQGRAGSSAPTWPGSCGTRRRGPRRVDRPRRPRAASIRRSRDATPCSIWPRSTATKPPR